MQAVDGGGYRKASASIDRSIDGEGGRARYESPIDSVLFFSGFSTLCFKKGMDAVPCCARYLLPFSKKENKQKQKAELS